MPDYVLYGGKGGVGKTTCAAATGLKLAGRGERTLVVSTDPAHSLGDAFETPVGGDPTELGPDLWGVEADPEAGQDVYRDVVGAVAAEFRSAGVSLEDADVERLFAAGVVPGSDELAALQFFDADEQWDTVVFDTAPTGHTLRLLTLPDVLAESLSTVGTLRGQLRRVVTAARSMVVGPAAYFGRGVDDDVVEALRERMTRIAASVRDPDRTDFRVVLTPETLAVEETRRFVERLRGFDVPVGTLVVNRVYEDVDEGCDRCRARKRSHAETLERLRGLFPGMDLQVVPDLGVEVYGRDALEEVAGYVEV